MKKISYPRLQGYLEFGDLREYHELLSIPLQLTLHNLSKFVHEKQVHYWILSSGCEIINPYVGLQKETLSYDSDISKKAKEILHYSMPYYDDYLLITRRAFTRREPIVIDITLTFWGELSPPVMSLYKLQIDGSNMSRSRSYCTIIEQKENIYLHEGSDHNLASEDERLEKSRKFLMEQFKNKIPWLPVHEQLRNKTAR